MGNIEFIVGLALCAALIIWGSGVKKGTSQILFIIVMLVLYASVQALFPEFGKWIFLCLVVVFGIASFVFKERLLQLVYSIFGKK